jgi:hypothetical protein
VLLESAVEAFVQAVLVLLLGGLAIGIAGGVWHQMTPSAPPIFKEHSWLNFGVPAFWSSGRTWLMGHRLPILFMVFFVLIARSRFAKPASGQLVSGRPSRMWRAGQRFSEDWFGLIVRNAFGALVAALVLYWVQQFSISQWFYRQLVEGAAGQLQEAFQRFVGVTPSRTLRDLLAWFSENQLKLTFWFFYVSAMCDDLGLTNFKTLARWCWHRLRNGGPKRPIQAAAKSVEA